jgi:adenylate cyclase
MPDRETPRVDDGGDVERLVRLGPKELTWPQVCARARVSHEVADPLWRALGFPDIPPEESAYTTDDVRALRIAADGIESVRGDHRRAALDAIVREARMVSSHMSRIAEIEVESMAELAALGLRERVLAEASERGVQHSDLGWVLLYAFRRRLEEALRRRTTLEAGDHPSLAMGFVDLVGFTRTSGSMQTDELGRLLGRFEALASDLITRRAAGSSSSSVTRRCWSSPPPTKRLRARSSSSTPAPQATCPRPALACRSVRSSPAEATTSAARSTWRAA